MAYRDARPPGAMTGAENDLGNRGSVDRFRWRGTTAATAVRWRGFDPRTRSIGGRWNRSAGRPYAAPGYRTRCRTGCPTAGGPGPGRAAPACPRATPAAAGAGLPAALRHAAAPAQKAQRAQRVRKAETMDRGPRRVPFLPALNRRDGYGSAAEQTVAHRARHCPPAARERAHSPERQAPPCGPRRRQPCVAVRLAPRPALPRPFAPGGALPPRCGAAS